MRYNKLCALVLALGLLPAVAAAQTVTVKDDHPDPYVVKKGDTLWDISGRFLNEPWLWPEVWEANPHIENPHLIYPGDEITLRYRDGRPIVTVGRRGAKGTVRLSPQVRVHELDTAIPTIPIDAIQQFLSRPRVVSEQQIDDAPYVVSVGRESLIGSPGRRIYARGIDGKRGDKFIIYRKGPPYVRSEGEVKSTLDGARARSRDPYAMLIEGDGSQTPPRGRASLHSMWIANNRGLSSDAIPPGEVLGYEAIHVAEAVMQRPGDPATLVVTGANRELLAGDRVFQVDDEEINSRFMPRAPSRDVSGKIISVVDGVSQIGKYQIVVLDVGQRDGIETGHVMAVYERGEIIPDPYAKQPPGRSAEFENKDVELDRDKQGGFDGLLKAMDDMVVDFHEK
ncbi:MAG: LysM peptidoglycan-binding domain-containing protein, partial [Gammaproteobacteria bacterium]|nr:LysM peptidoglycan-binding domain-containing protein [Gammaproteobacteria bacterium]